MNLTSSSRLVEEIAPTRRQPFSRGLEWPIVVFLGTVHLLGLALCLAFPSWEGFILFLILYLVTGLGVTVGYHRKVTHQSFRSPLWFEYALAVLGLLAGEGPPIFWAAIHRQHHRHSDGPEDPHSPHDGFWWAHALWMLPKMRRTELGRTYSAYAPDLVRHRFYQFLERTYLYWHLGFAVLLTLAGAWLGSWRMALSFLAYGYFLRMVVVLHATWMVNSVSHRWGYRNYRTDDDSRNNAIVALFAHGEGWHNNHHHSQVAANHGHSWREFDLSFGVILLLGVLTWPLGWIGLNRWRLLTDVRVFSASTGKIQLWLSSGRDRRGDL
jgi:fatty-acid desaturase